MKIFTDESGDFSLTNSRNSSLVASLICTEDIYDDIKRFMYAFERRYNNGNEIKGSRITFEQRLKVCQFIKKNQDQLKISLTTISPEMVTPNDLKEFRSLQSQTFERNKEWYITRGGNSENILSHFDRIIKISQYQSRMSDEDFLQAIILVQQLYRVLTYCMVYFYESKYRRNFKEFSFVFDGKQPNKLSGMEKYFKTYVMPFLDAQSKIGERIPMVDFWRKGHPFIDQYTMELDCGNRGLYLNKIFGENSTFINSKVEPGLRIVDIISNTVYNYLVNPNSAEFCECFNVLKSAIGVERGNNPLNYVTLQSKKTFWYKEPE